MARRKKRQFSPEFKSEAVKMVEVGERGVLSVARDLDLTPSALREWVLQSKANSGAPLSSSSALSSEEREELLRLRRENKRLLMEREILDLALDALNQALAQRNTPSGMIVHHDRSVQYASRAYRERLQENGLRASMSRKGDCWDNAVAESFFATLKRELVPQSPLEHAWPGRSPSRGLPLDFYNLHRRHSTLGYRSPVEFELRARTQELS